MGNKKPISAFRRFRLKWMPFANLAVIGIALLAVFQLPHANLRIIEPVASPVPPSTTTEISGPFNLRLHVDHTVGCDYEPSTFRVVATPSSGAPIPIDNLVLDHKSWVASDIKLPLGEYRLAISVQVHCESEDIKKEMNIKVICRPLTVAQAKAQGDACGEYVSDNCGGFVSLPSCRDFGANDLRIKKQETNCKQTGFYVGQSTLTYVEGGETRHYFAALKCGSGNDTDCYQPPASSGSCKTSKSPEIFSYYGDKKDPAFHRCRIECPK